MIDLRSDTVTKPSPSMREAMYTAEVGDDVMGEDPTVNQLEIHAAKLLGKEAALFVTSGTQGNLLSVLSHCQRGDEYIAGTASHVYRWEAGGSSVLGGVPSQTLEAEEDGTLDLEKIQKLIKPDDAHFAKTKLLILENTHGGKVLPLDYLKKFETFAKTHNLNTHLDGARLFNAATASLIPALEIAKHFDSLTFCLSKGLGAPVGSIICATKEFIAKARRLRKMVGGGMRQAGILAAAGLYALEHNIHRLSEDHQNASHLAKELNLLGALKGKVQVHTNMVFVNVGPIGQKIIPDFFRSNGIAILGNETLRLVTHLDISKKDIDHTISVFQEFYASKASKQATFSVEGRSIY
jgi:threonine aldolase